MDSLLTINLLFVLGRKAGLKEESDHAQSTSGEGMFSESLFISNFALIVENFHCLLVKKISPK